MPIFAAGRRSGPNRAGTGAPGRGRGLMGTRRGGASDESVGRMRARDVRKGTAVFVDGGATHAAARAAGFGIDYGRLLASFRAEAGFLRAHFYATPREEQGVRPLQPLLDWLDYAGYAVRTFPDDGRIPEGLAQGRLDVALAVEALALAPRLERAVLFSSGHALVPLIGALRSGGVRVDLVSTLGGRGGFVSDEARRAADRFLDLADLRDAVGRIPEAEGEPSGEPAAP